MNSRRLAIALAYAAICLIWGTTWLAIKIGLENAPPVTAVGLRFLIAGIVLYAVAAFRGALVAPRALPWPVVLVYASCLFGLNYVLTYTSEVGLASGLTAVLFATMPFFTYFFRAWLMRERTPAAVWVGTAVAFGGVAVISLDAGVRGSLPYAAAALGAAALSAFANVFGKRGTVTTPLVVLPPAMLIAGVVVLAAGIVFEHAPPAVFLVPSSLGAMLYLALIGSALAFVLNQWLLARIDVSALNLSSLIFPLVALIAGALVLHEVVRPAAALGIVLIIAGTWYTLARVAPR